MTFQTIRASVVPFCLAFVCTSAVLSPAKAGAADAPKRDPDAVRLLHEVGKAYRALPAYSDRAEVTITLGTGHLGPFDQSSVVRLTYQRSDRFVIETDKHRLVSDGEKLIIANKPFKQYISKPAPTGKTGGPGTSGMHDGLDTMTAMELFLDIPVFLEWGVLMPVVRGDDPMEALVDEQTSVSFAPDTVLEAKPAKVLVIAEEFEKRQFQIRLMIDPGSKLLKRLELTESEHGKPVKIVWTAQSISTKVPDVEVFAVRPPPGFAHAKGNTLKGTAVMSMAKHWALGFMMGRQGALGKD